MSNLVEAARAIIRARNYHAEHGCYDTKDFHPDEDQSFDDWAADILETVLANDDNQKRDLAVVIDGGLVQAIISNGDDIGRTVTVIDYDTEGAEDDEVVEVEQGDGNTVSAFVAHWKVTKSLIVIPKEGEIAG